MNDETFGQRLQWKLLLAGIAAAFVIGLFNRSHDIDQSNAAMVTILILSIAAMWIQADSNRRGIRYQRSQFYLLLFFPYIMIPAYIFQVSPRRFILYLICGVIYLAILLASWVAALLIPTF